MAAVTRLPRPPTGRRRIGLALVCALGLASLPRESLGAAAAPASLEQAVKASFLFKFAPFVEWPPSAAGRTFVICVTGEDPFGAALDDVVRGQRVSGRPVNVRRVSADGNTSGCHMLFAGRSGADGYSPFADLAGRPILTVTDSGSGVSGAMIQFVMQGGRVRFQIDDGAARANGLSISSKLLGLAIPVDRK